MADIKSRIREWWTPQRLTIAVVIVAAGLAFVLLLDNLIMPWYTKHGEALAVPNIVAKRYEVAKEILEEHGLEVVKAGEKHDANLPFGYVAEQNPAPNRLVKEGRRVYLTISVGERDVEVPNLVGLSEKNAGERLKSAGLRIGEIDYVYVPNEVQDVVISQSPRPDELVKISSVVDLTVSLGQPTENVTVPALLGKTLAVGKREVQKSGLTLGDISYAVNDQLLPNTIMNQSLEPGLVVDYGDTLDLTVSTVSQ